MNAQQGKVLLQAARNALALLDPQWTTTQLLKQAIAQAEAVTPKIKSGKIPKVRYSEGCVWRDGKCLDADDAWTFANGVHAHFWPEWGQERKLTSMLGLATDSYDPHAAEREAEKERLSHCACTHLATEHFEDKDGNLLKCDECECEQFHYAAKEAA